MIQNVRRRTFSWPSGGPAPDPPRIPAWNRPAMDGFRLAPQSRRALLRRLAGGAVAGFGATRAPIMTAAQATPIMGSPVAAAAVGRYPVQIRDVVYRQDET